MHCINEQTKAKAIAFYLPQFHPIPENDKWWGKGFTEWTNVAKAQPLFRGHAQPNLPADLGFYDLRVPEIRNAQAEIAQKYGIYGFCYWHYWFGNGRTILERPLNEIVQSGEPDFPFCIAWANESWTGIWHGVPNKILMEQLYPGKEDYIRFFASILPALSDRRYIRISGKPLLVIYKPLEHPELQVFVDVFQNEAIKAGLGGLHIAGFTDSVPILPEDYHLDAVIYSNFSYLLHCSQRPICPEYYLRKINQLRYLLSRYPVKVFPYNMAIKRWMEYENFTYPYYPVVFPNWDNSPRSGKKSVIITGSTPELFETHINDTLQKLNGTRNQEKFLFIKSWNEWAEGNYMEPDARWDRQFLEVFKKTISSHEFILKSQI